jgi:hypothetical protein
MKGKQTMTNTNNTTTSISNEPVDINRHVHQLLAKHHSIAAIWCIDDVKGIRPHLTDEQAWEVLEEVGRKHDAEWGITWMTLETMADDLFPMATSRRRQP